MKKTEISFLGLEYIPEGKVEIFTVIFRRRLERFRAVLVKTPFKLIVVYNSSQVKFGN